ncbi:HlyD family secretion protein [Pantoea alhagi]|uniref:biotin/lipoyl-binding protein n=1 Tax=Pantoea alhagi TaxID=1891675 RepID=UPI00202B4586|nr:biotin/lipoyl-binding protein [Pantoea alhagi]URQ60665.1 HlyD family secretion protein [Pantoea alhagi]
MNKKNDYSGLSLPTDNPPAASKTERYFQRLGMLTIFIGLFGFLIWAAAAPLDKGVTAPGTVTVNGNRKTVQSSGNGIVERVLVKEGDTVQAGVPLIELSHVQATARYEQYRDKYLTALATHARLKAEQQGINQPDFPELLRHQAWRSQGEMLISLQQALLEARMQALSSEIDGSQHNLASLQYQIQSMQRSLTLKRKLNHSLRQQLNDMRALADENFLPRNRYRETGAAAT